MKLSVLTNAFGDVASELQDMLAHAAHARFGLLFDRNEDGSYSPRCHDLKLPMLAEIVKYPEIVGRYLSSVAIDETEFEMEIPINLPGVESGADIENDLKDDDDESDTKGFSFFHHRKKKGDASQDIDVTTGRSPSGSTVKVRIKFKGQPAPEGLLLLQNKLEDQFHRDLGLKKREEDSNG